MSKNINLVEYATNDNDKLYETKYELIETVFISSDIYDKIVKDYPLVKKNVFEKIESEDCYSIECFDDSQVINIISKLEELFISILKYESDKILNQDNISDSSQHPIPSNNYIQFKEVERSINKFRTITNLINVFKLKSTKYSGNTSLVLKIG